MTKLASLACAPQPGALARVLVREGSGWHFRQRRSSSIWFKGHLHGGLTTDAAALYVLDTIESTAIHQLDQSLLKLDGFFAFVLRSDEFSLAAVDHARSIPLAYSAPPQQLALLGDAVRIADELHLNAGHIDRFAALAVAMSGYTIGPDTLFPNIRQLQPGEYLLLRPGNAPLVKRYYGYRPWTARPEERGRMRRRLRDVTLSVLEKTLRSVDGRPIMLPLSAGLDSRLIASGFRKLGYRDVHCLAYGLPGNYEATASRQIAEALGFRWTFIPNSIRQQRATFLGQANKSYCEFSDALCAIPFQQDFHAVETVLATGFAPRDAVFINGQTGDYISGNHVPAVFAAPTADNSDEGRWQRILDATVAKHFSAWGYLKTPETLAKIKHRLRVDLEVATGGLREPEVDFALYEESEFRHRQSKYVISGQRIYEYFGAEWRLPLWDRDYVDFWATVPFDFKFRQALYREMLLEENWGGVWRGHNFPRRVPTRWLRVLRLGLRALHAPLGRKAWHRFERHFLAYWTDIAANYAVVPYGTVVRDRRGHRNAISWHIEAYLSAKGLRLDDLQNLQF